MRPGRARPASWPRCWPGPCRSAHPRRPRGYRRRRRATTVHFRSAFSRVTATASGSTSTARTVSAPSASATSERTPLPQPTSSTRDPRRAAPRSERISATSRVVSCSPVPNARPGSSSMTCSPGASAYGRHGAERTPPGRCERARSASSTRRAWRRRRPARGAGTTSRRARRSRRPRRARHRSCRPVSPCLPRPGTRVVASRSSTPCAPSSNRTALARRPAPG